jgi:glycosyltransferase involved in cell wall biosynthesis
MRRWFAHVSVVFDHCAAEAAEYRESLESKGELSDLDRRRLRQVELVEERAATEADHILCASQALADYLAERYPDQLPDVTVVPRSVDASEFAAAARHRDAMRRELGLADRFVVAYKGSLHQYQCLDESLRIFKAIKATRPYAHFLGLTGSTERLRQMCLDAGIRQADYTILPVEMETVPRFLAASDVGLVPRRQTEVNRLAAPVKFPEYLASGTPVILSEHLGDYSALVRREHVGVVLRPAANGGGILDLSSLNAFIAEYSSDVSGWRHRCRHTARRYFDWSVHFPNVTSVYHDASRRSHVPA